MATEPFRSDATAIRLAEYEALRTEILSRFSSQRQFLSLAIIASGSLFVASIQSKDSNEGALLILGYPVLALFLAAGWAHNARRIYQIGTYIFNIEENLGSDASGKLLMGWEHHPLPAAMEYLTSRGIFVGTELFAILIGASLANMNQVVNAVNAGTALSAVDPRVAALLILSVLCLPVTFIIIPRHLQTHKKTKVLK